MSRLFYTFQDKPCNILHSSFFNSMSYAQRRDFAFNKTELKKLSSEDQLLMQGYAANIVERQKAYKYKHPDYKRKTAKRQSKK